MPCQALHRVHLDDSADRSRMIGLIRANQSLRYKAAPIAHTISCASRFKKSPRQTAFPSLRPGRAFAIMPKRKSSAVSAEIPVNGNHIPDVDSMPPPLKRRQSSRKSALGTSDSVNPDKNAEVLDAPQALRASPDAEGSGERLDLEATRMNVDKQIKEEEPPPTGLEAPAETKTKGKKSAQKKTKKGAEVDVKAETPEASTPAKSSKAASATKDPQFLDPEADGDEEPDELEIKEALSRPPPVHSDYLPLPWKGRLGYVSRPICFLLAC